MASSASLPRIFTNPHATSYTSTPSPSLSSHAIYDFHASLPTSTGPTALTPLSNAAKAAGVKNVYVKDERVRFTDLPSPLSLGLSWAIRNGIIAELSEEAPVGNDISLSDLVEKVKEAQTKLVAASNDDFGRVVARLGMVFGVRGIDTRIFIPADAEELVKDNVRTEGAEAIVVQGEMEEAVREAWLHSVAVDGVMVSVEVEEEFVDFPRWIIEGYSTIFREIDQQLEGQQLDWLVLPVGNGGLAQAAVVHYKAPREDGRVTRILTVETENAASLYETLERGEGGTGQGGTGGISATAWEVLKEGIDGSVVVGEEDVEGAREMMEGKGGDSAEGIATMMAGVNAVLGDERVRESLGMRGDAVVVLIGT